MRTQADVATALREGRLHVIPASELVPGDVVEVAGGLHLTCLKTMHFQAVLSGHFSSYLRAIYGLAEEFVLSCQCTAVGVKVPADLRMVELLSNVFRVDQVCSLSGDPHTLYAVSSLTSSVGPPWSKS